MKYDCRLNELEDLQGKIRQTKNLEDSPALFNDKRQALNVAADTEGIGNLNDLPPPMSSTFLTTLVIAIS